MAQEETIRFEDGTTMTIPKRGEIAMKLDDVYADISWRQIAHNYFDRSASWLYNKLYEKDTNKNGKPNKFTDEEIEILKGALIDTADRLRAAADKL